MLMPLPNPPPSPSAEWLPGQGLIHSRFGFYEMKDKPNEANLEEYCRHNYYQKEGGSCLASHDEECITLPRFPAMTDDDVQRVLESLLIALKCTPPQIRRVVALTSSSDL